MADERAVEPLPSLAALAGLSVGRFPGHVGFRVVEVAVGRVRAELDVAPHLHAPNGFLHAGVVVTLADTACGYGVRTCMPVGAKGFTTLELKSNFLGTALDGTIHVDATLVHGGRRTQVWDATVRSGPAASGSADVGAQRVLALFRCTQLILW
jgi:1,4-dihydroxy-2-naphthoyl-CoA hydrolase